MISTDMCALQGLLLQEGAVKQRWTSANFNYNMAIDAAT